MATNPTPLTAESVFESIRLALCVEKVDEYVYLEGCIPVIEAYAAQQNPELVATISQLNSDIAELVAENKRRVKELVNEYAGLRSVAMKYREKVLSVQAENERLKQQLEWQPIPEDPKEGDKIFAVTSMRPQPEWFFWDTQKYNKAPKPFWHNLQSGVNWSRLYPPTAHFVVPQPPKESNSETVD